MTNQFLITTTSSTSPTTVHSLVPGQSGGQPIRNTPLVVGAHSINPIIDQYSAGGGLRQYTELITAGAIILDHSPRASWLLNNVVVEPRISNGCVITRIGHEGRTVRVNESKLLSIQRVLAIFNIRKSEAFGRLQIDIRDDKGNIHILKLDLGTDYITSITICFRKAIRASTKLGNRRKNVSNSRRGKSGNTSSNIDDNPLKRKLDLVEELDEFSKLSLKKKPKMNNNNDEHYLCSQLSRLKLKESSYLFPTLDHEDLQEKEDTQEETSPIVITEQIQTTSFDSLLGFIDIRDSVGNIHTLKSDIDPRHINSICTSKSRGGKSGNTSSNIDKRNVDELSVDFKLDIKKSKTQGFCSKFSSLTLQETEDTQEETSNPIILAPEQIQHTLLNSTLDSFELKIKFVIHNKVSYCNSLPKRECNASEAQQILKQEVKERLASDANFENLLFSEISGKDVDQQQISNLLKWLENEKSNNNFVTLVEKALNKTEGERVQDAKRSRTPVKKAANQRKDIIKQATDQSRIKPFQKALEELDSFAVLNCNIEKWKKLASSEQLFNILEKCSETLLCELLRENSRDSQGQNNSSKEDEMSAYQSKSSKELQISHNLWY